MLFSSPAHTSRSFRLFVFASVSAFALMLAGCSSTPKEEQFAASANETGPGLQGALGYWSERYRANPSNAEASYAYARALMASDQRAQAVAVLQRAVLANPYDFNLKGALGNALAGNGQYDEALNMFQQAHTPDKPNWRVLSAQGAVLDQMGRPQDARKYYQTALRLSPDEPSVLSNLAMSYALTGDLPAAERTLEKAAKNPKADARVRQNLALIVGLQGRYSDSERIASRDLSAADAQQNVQAVRSMLAQQNSWQDIQGGGSVAPPAPAYGGGVPFAASAPNNLYTAPAPNNPYAAPAPNYANGTFATSVNQQPYGGYQQPVALVPYGYTAPEEHDNRFDWQERARQNSDRRNN
jgi:Flp pilus assembly protein TadD